MDIPVAAHSFSPELSRIFSLFGVSSLLTFSFVMIALPYLSLDLGGWIGSHLNMVYGSASCVGQVVGIAMGTIYSKDVRIISSCLGLLTCSIAIPVLLLTGIPYRAFVALSVMAALGFVGSVFQSCFSGLAGLVSPDALALFFVGQSVAGLLPLPLLGALRIGFLTTGESSAAGRYMLIVGLALSGLAILGTLLVYWILFGDSTIRRTKVKLPDWADVKRTVTTIRSVGVSVFLISVLSFSLYPGHMLRWTPSHLSKVDVAFYQSAMLYAAIVSDIVGMSVPVWGVKASLETVRIGAFLRFVCLPAFVLTHTSLLGSDWMRLGLVIVMSSSGAFLFSSAMEGVFELVGDRDHDVVGYIVSFCFTTGMTAGGLLGHILDSLMF